MSHSDDDNVYLIDTKRLKRKNLCTHADSFYKVTCEKCEKRGCEFCVRLVGYMQGVFLETKQRLCKPCRSYCTICKKGKYQYNCDNHEGCTYCTKCAYTKVFKGCALVTREIFDGW